MNALALLRRQHDDVRELLNQLRSAVDGGSRAVLRDRVVAALRAHSAIEEELFYPQLEAEDETQDLIEDSFLDHEEMKEVLAELERADVEDEEFGAIADELEDVVMTHVAEEEDELFPQVEEMWPVAHLDEVGARMKDRFEELSSGHDELHA